MTARPVFIVNCKAYENAGGEALVALAKDLAQAASIKGVHLILAVPATEIRTVVAAVAGTGAQVYAQHTDPVPYGAFTGHLPPALVKAAGATGTILNHSEHRITETLADSVAAARRAGLQVVLCVRDDMEVRVYRNLDVEYIAVEPPELIGGTVSVSSARPELIALSAKHCPDKLLVGAGIKTRADIVKAIELGARGVLIASGVVRAPKPKDAFLELASGW